MDSHSNPEGEIPHNPSEVPHSGQRDEVDRLLGSTAAADFMLDGDLNETHPSSYPDDDPYEGVVTRTDEEFELEEQRRKERLKAIDGPELLKRLESGEIEGLEDDISIVLGALSEYEYLFMPMLYGLNDEGVRATPNYIAKWYGLPVKRVKEIQASAIKKISSGDYSW